MKKFRWQLLIILLTGLIVGVILFLQKETTTGPNPASTPSPISGGIYTEALVGNFLRLNPLLEYHNQPDRDVNRLLFNSLVKFDASGLPQPDLAVGWNSSEGDTRFTFSLRTDVVWHDGSPFSAQDVAYTVQLLKSGSAVLPDDLRQFWSEVNINVLSDELIEFTLPEAFSPFLDYLSFGILPAHLLGGLDLNQLIDHPYNLAPIGTGPYRFKQLNFKDGVITGVQLEANEYYFGGRPYIQDVNFVYFPDERAAFAAFQAGEVDGLAGIAPDLLPDILADENINLYSTREPKLSMILLNLNNDAKGFLKDQKFRRALMVALNRQAMIDRVMNGQAILAQGPVLTGSWAYYDALEPFSFDPEVARQILATAEIVPSESGVGLVTKDGVEVSLVLLVQNDPRHLAIAETIKANWESVGIQTTLLAKSHSEILNDLTSHAFDAALVDIDLSGTPDPDPYPFWGQAMIQTGQNYAQWDNRTASSYLEQARLTLDIEMRTKLYRNFQVLFQEELPSLPLFYPIFNYGVRDTILDINIGPIYQAADRFNDVNTWYILTGTNDPTQIGMDPTN
ncbi:MAG: peptide ABC transporter substrate-binding protein [Anaerolineaceae bacterium]